MSFSPAPQKKPDGRSDSARKADQSVRAKARAAKDGMPISTGRPLKAVALEPDYKHPDLIAGGLARPGREAKNVLKYGYESVQDHYVNGPADLPIAALARVWNITPTTIQRWINDFGWGKLRAERLSETSVLHGGTKGDDIVKAAREQFLEKETKIINLMLDDIEERLEDKIEELMSPTGKLEKVKKRAATLRTEVQTFKMISEHARMALGLRTKPGIFEGANIDARSVTIINETRPAQAETTAYLNETLKEILPPEMDAIEGEVVEKP
jgi:hypothetical protein